MTTLYDTIGKGYSTRRRADPRIAAQIWQALGGAKTVVNVGAGTGSYEPADRLVTAVEPSAEMIAQRPPASAPVVRASAEALPFDTASFDAAMASLTVHHWQDKAAGLAEMRRVARNRVVIFTVDPWACDFWLFDYFPNIRALDRSIFPRMAAYETALGPVQVTPMPVPHDCQDGFLGAYWRRPEAYFDPAVFKATSAFHLINNPEAGLAKLRGDLDAGRWHQRYGHLMDQDAFDLGYRLVVAEFGETL